MTRSSVGRLHRRRFLVAVAAGPLVLGRCRLDRAGQEGAGFDEAGRVGEASEEGRLHARPGAPVAAAPTSAGTRRLDLGEGRAALVYVPEGLPPDRPSPMAVMLHGAGGTAEDGLNLLRPFADDTGLLLLAPASRGTTWDLLTEGYGPDVALIDEALAQVFERHEVDAAHLGIGGFSDGASYALSLGARNGTLFSHVMAFSPGFWAPGAIEGSPAFFVTHGTDDPVLPIDATSRRVVPRLERAGYQVRYHEFPGGHVVPGDLAAEGVQWFLGDD